MQVSFTLTTMATQAVQKEIFGKTSKQEDIYK